MITITLNKKMAESVREQSQKEGAAEPQIYNRWAMLGKLAEDHPEMLAGDLIAYLHDGVFPSTALTDAPMSLRGIEHENESVRMMMKVLVYALKRNAPQNKSAARAMDLMKQLGMYKMTDVLR